MIREFIAAAVVAGALTVGTGTAAQANPCAAKNPCAARNPCAAKAAAAAKDPAAQAAFRQFSGWKKVNAEPVKSETHGNTLVFTYINPKAEAAAMSGKFPFADGAVLVKDSFTDAGGKPGEHGSVFVMEKRKGYDAPNGDWHYAVLGPDGDVQMSGSGKAGSPTQFCSACHRSAGVNDYVFGNGTTMKVRPVTTGAPKK